MGENIFQIVSGKRLASRTYKELQLNKKKNKQNLRTGNGSKYTFRQTRYTNGS